MSRGGKRTGAGKPKGYKHQRTLEKEAQYELIRQLVMQHVEPMTLAQIEHAKGVAYLTLRMPDGSYARATDEKQINAAIAVGGEVLQIFTQAPNTQAFADLLNRAFGKPPERVEVSGPDGKDLTIVVKKPW